MNVFDLTREDSARQLERLEELVLAAYQKPPLAAGTVISACGALSESLCEEKHLPLLLSLGTLPEKARRELKELKLMTSREYLQRRLALELGEPSRLFMPCGGEREVRQEWQPLGTLLHIAAGNVDALPAFSVIEGLLAGNVNILKLPENDDGLSALALEELVKFEPVLNDYVFVVNCPSSRADDLKRLAETADAVVIWGGDEAMSAVRRMTPPDTKIIEWGHKLSFAYVSGSPSDAELEGLAFNICDTEQLLCSSCQGVFLDADSFDPVCIFAERFLGALERASERTPQGDEKLAAQRTLELYTEELEALPESKRVFRGRGCGVIAYNDSELSPSHMFRSCWVRPLPRGRIIETLKPHKNRLQTAALLCGEAERPELEALLTRAGAVRITSADNMSATYCGAPHDGEQPLRRYMKLTSYEY